MFCFVFFFLSDEKEAVGENVMIVLKLSPNGLVWEIKVEQCALQKQWLNCLPVGCGRIHNSHQGNWKKSVGQLNGTFHAIDTNLYSIITNWKENWLTDGVSSATKGATLSNLLVNAGLTTFKKIEETHPREIELVCLLHAEHYHRVKLHAQPLKVTLN